MQCMLQLAIFNPPGATISISPANLTCGSTLGSHTSSLNLIHFSTLSQSKTNAHFGHKLKSPSVLRYSKSRIINICISFKQCNLIFCHVNGGWEVQAGIWGGVPEKIGIIRSKPPPGSLLPGPLGHMPRFKVPNMKHASLSSFYNIRIIITIG